MPVSACHDLHGNAPDQSPVCLLIIDKINPLDFEGADRIVEAAETAAQHIAGLKRRARAAGVPTLYVNDNFGKWQSDFRKLVEHCTRGECRGKRIAELLHPEDDDYFVLKPKHSGFYATPLELLLQVLGTQHLLLTGIAGNNCVLHTAIDAYMREFKLVVPSDYVASETDADNRVALDHMKRMLKADIRPAGQLTVFSELRSLRAPDGRARGVMES
jgi:nicotinamidase-related amidase